MATLRTAQMLKRFAAQVPDAPFPKAVSDLTGQQQMRLAEADPELFAVMSGTATAALEASVMDGTFAESYTAPSQEQLNSARVQEILAQSPAGTKGFYQDSGQYVAGKEQNLSLLMELAHLSPQQYEAEKLRANPPQPNENAVSAESAARMNAELAATRLQSLNNSNGVSN